jgi:hypothetical protein
VTTPLSLQNGIYKVFFCLSARSVNKDKIFWFKLKTEEKGTAVKELLAYPTVMC